MPNYDFECKKCKETYNEIVPYDETGKYKGVKCPHCGSKSKIKLKNEEINEEINNEINNETNNWNKYWYYC